MYKQINNKTSIPPIGGPGAAFKSTPSTPSYATIPPSDHFEIFDTF